MWYTVTAILPLIRHKGLSAGTGDTARREPFKVQKPIPSAAVYIYMLRIHLLVSYQVPEPLGPFQTLTQQSCPRLQERSITYQQNQTCWTLSRRQKKTPNYTAQFVGMGKILPSPHTWQSAFPSATQASWQLDAGRGWSRQL